jgi:hypothetical protein
MNPGDLIVFEKAVFLQPSDCFYARDSCNTCPMTSPSCDAVVLPPGEPVLVIDGYNSKENEMVTLITCGDGLRTVFEDQISDIQHCVACKSPQIMV